MKKFLLLLSLSAATVLTTAANPVINGDPRAERAFNKMFAGASHINWEKTKEGINKVSFVWGDRRAIAFFDEKAELIGTIRGLFFKELPLSVAKAVSDNLENPVILEINEIYNTEGISYTLMVEEKNKKYSMRLNSLGYILEKERVKK